MPVPTATDLELAHAAAQRVVQTHQRVADFLRVGMKLPQIDAFVAKTLEQLGASSCFLGYTPDRRHFPFPSHACLSVNDCVVHGTAASLERPLTEGDVLKIDIGVFFRGWVGDAAWTYAIGEPTPAVRRLMDCGKESLRRGIAALKPGAVWLDWAKAVHPFVETEQRFKLIRGLGGHGIGFKRLHGPPFVSNTLPAYPGEWPDALRRCTPGTIVAVEPMIAISTGDTRQKPLGKGRSDWPVYTADGSMSVHYEHDVLITEDGHKVLSEGLDDLPDVITKAL